MQIFSSDNHSDGELVEKEQKQRIHEMNFSQISQGENEIDKEYLRELTQHGLDEHTVALLDNMVSQDFVLSYLQSAEVTEVKWLSRSIARKVKRMHPPEQSVVQGEYRKVLLDDSRDALRSLTPSQENLVDQAMLDIFTRVARSRDGWQQDEMSKQLRVSKTEDDSKTEQKGGLFR